MLADDWASGDFAPMYSALVSGFVFSSMVMDCGDISDGFISLGSLVVVVFFLLLGTGSVAAAAAAPPRGDDSGDGDSSRDSDAPSLSERARPFCGVL